MRCLILDGHPDSGRLVTGLLDAYAAALPAGTEIVRVAVRDLSFDPILHRGYVGRQELEPDLAALAREIEACDHLVVGFPMWWGAEPALLKGLLDRVFQPGWAFRYHQSGPYWDRLLAGRSADLVVTMDTPPWFLSLAFGNPVIKRWKKQVLGHVGIKPVRVFRFGPVRKGGAEASGARWLAQLARAGASAARVKRAARFDASTG